MIVRLIDRLIRNGEQDMNKDSPESNEVKYL